MWLKKISFINFRNFKEKSFSFNPFLTIVIGENAKGKTNLLEGVYCLINGRGFRENNERELVFFNQKRTKIEGVFEEKDQKFVYEIVFKKINETVIQKNYFVDKVKTTLFYFKRQPIKTVLFFPSQLEIIDGSMEKRRKYFDQFLSQHDPEYKKKLNNYQQALRKRNKILEDFGNKGDFLSVISFWNNYLLEQAPYLLKKRKEYCQFLNENSSLNGKNFFIDYQPDIITKKRLADVFDKEIRYRRTLIGPHKDSFSIFLKNNEEKNLCLFGSRSEQRLALFWLKKGEIKYLEKILKVRPIMLLDDIFSELDFKNRQLVFSLIKGYQVILTTTDIAVIDMFAGPKSLIKI